MTPITKGDFVKIRLQREEGDTYPSERVWCEVMEALPETQELKLRIDNSPVVTDFKLNDIVVVPVSFVLDFMEAKK